jgi:hypothetical protein
VQTLIEINRGPHGEPGEQVDAQTYIHLLQAQLAALEDVLAAARLVVGDSADGSGAVANLCQPQNQDGDACMDCLVDAVRAYDRRNSDA